MFQLYIKLQTMISAHFTCRPDNINGDISVVPDTLVDLFYFRYEQHSIITQNEY
jgi:hypothetical protein